MTFITLQAQGQQEQVPRVGYMLPQMKHTLHLSCGTSHRGPAAVVAGQQA